MPYSDLINFYAKYFIKEPCARLHAIHLKYLLLYIIIPIRIADPDLVVPKGLIWIRI